MKCLHCGNEQGFSRNDFRVFMGMNNKKAIFRSKSEYECHRCGERFYFENGVGFYKTYTVKNEDEENEE